MSFSVASNCVESACTRQAALTTQQFRRGLSSLATIAATAPLCGIIGSIFGFTDAFQSIGASHLRGRTEFSIAFADSLVPTLTGLFVATIALTGHRFLTLRTQQLALEMRNQTIELLNRLAYHA